ncbi:MAG: hypothetical protein RL732_1366 [Bacteroidota bacterium]|jgi:hypothetical protein
MRTNLYLHCSSFYQYSKQAAEEAPLFNLATIPTDGNKAI